MSLNDDTLGAGLPTPPRGDRRSPWRGFDAGGITMAHTTGRRAVHAWRQESSLILFLSRKPRHF